MTNTFQKYFGAEEEKEIFMITSKLKKIEENF